VADVSGVGTHSSSRRLSTLARCQGRHAARREKFFFCCTIDCITAHSSRLRYERKLARKASRWSARRPPPGSPARRSASLIPAPPLVGRRCSSRSSFARQPPLPPLSARAACLQPPTDCLALAALSSMTSLRRYSAKLTQVVSERLPRVMKRPRLSVRGSRLFPVKPHRTCLATRPR
jgi:hypothetical protein